MDESKNIFSSKFFVVGLFAVVSLLLTIPTMLLLLQQQQNIQTKALEPSPTIPQLSATFGAIAGYVYIDANKNGERDPGEQAFPNITVTNKQIDPQGTTTDTSNITSNEKTATTDTNGYFKFPFSKENPASTSYLVKVVLPDNYKTINTNPLLLTNVLRDRTTIVEFGLFPINTLGVKTIAPTKTIKPTISPTKKLKESSISGSINN